MEEKPEKKPGRLKSIGGSDNDDWNTYIANQISALGWTGSLTDEEKKQQKFMLVGAVMGMKPADEFESMIIGQMIGVHNMAMEMMRRSMIEGQPVGIVNECINHTNKLCRTHATLIEALNRHRGKGQQKITVEYSNITNNHTQAVINAGAVGITPKIGRQSYEPRAETIPELAHLRGKKEEVGRALQGESNEEWPMQNTWRDKSRSAKGKHK